MPKYLNETDALLASLLGLQRDLFDFEQKTLDSNLSPEIIHDFSIITKHLVNSFSEENTLYIIEKTLDNLKDKCLIKFNLKMLFAEFINILFNHSKWIEHIGIDLNPLLKLQELENGLCFKNKIIQNILDKLSFNTNTDEEIAEPEEYLSAHDSKLVILRIEPDKLTQCHIINNLNKFTVKYLKVISGDFDHLVNGNNDCDEYLQGYIEVATTNSLKFIFDLSSLQFNKKIISDLLMPLNTTLQTTFLRRNVQAAASKFWDGPHNILTDYSSESERREEYNKLYKQNRQSMLALFESYLNFLKILCPQITKLCLVEIACGDSAKSLKHFSQAVKNNGFVLEKAIGLEKRISNVENVRSKVCFKEPVYAFFQSDMINTKHDLKMIFKALHIEFSDDMLIICIGSGAINRLVLDGTLHALAVLSQLQSFFHIMFLSGVSELLVTPDIAKSNGCVPLFVGDNQIILAGKRNNDLSELIRINYKASIQYIENSPFKLGTYKALDLSMVADPIAILKNFREYKEIEKINLSFSTFGISGKTTDHEIQCVINELFEALKDFTSLTEIEYYAPVISSIALNFISTIAYYLSTFQRIIEAIRKCCITRELKFNPVVTSRYPMLGIPSELPSVSEKMSKRINIFKSKSLFFSSIDNRDDENIMCDEELANLQL